MTQSTHAPYAPSAMHRIVRCPGSVRATANIPELPSAYADDGTDAHALIAAALTLGVREATVIYDGLPEHTTHRADTKKERIEAVQAALDEVYHILDCFPDAVLKLETRVKFPSAHTDECWGTADIVIVIPSLGIVYVLDYKHGAGVFVDVKDNEQTGTYACGVLNTIPEAANCHTIVTGIIQPRAFSDDGFFRTDIQSASYYSTVFQPHIDAAIAASQAEDAPLVPGAKQCQWCPLKANCPAREAAALAVASTAFSSVRDVSTAALPAVSQLPVDRLAYIMSAAHVLKGWLKDVESAAFELARNGTYVPGFKLVETRPQREWHNDESTTAMMLMSLAGVDEDAVRPRQLIGVTEAEKLVVNHFKEQVGRGKKKEAAEHAKIAFAQLTTKQSSGNLVLVPESDARPAVNIAQTAFANVQLMKG